METVDQIVLLMANKLGLLDELEIEDIKEYEAELLSEMNNVHGDVMRQIIEKKALDKNLEDKLTDLITVFTTKFRLIEN